MNSPKTTRIEVNQAQITVEQLIKELKRMPLTATVKFNDHDGKETLLYTIWISDLSKDRCKVTLDFYKPIG